MMHKCTHTHTHVQQELIAIERQVQNAKQKALKLLDVARRVSGVKDLSVDPTLMKTCQALPQEVEKIDDMIHEYQAQADMCVGTDAVVSACMCVYACACVCVCVCVLVCAQHVTHALHCCRWLVNLKTGRGVSVCLMMRYDNV